MEKKLQPLKNKLLLFFFFVLSVGVFGQTLVNYPLNNNLNPDAAPDASITPTTLEYFDPPSTTPITNTQHAFGYLDYNNSGDYLQFNFNLPANDNVTLQVNAGTAVFLSSVTGNIQIYAEIGSSPPVLLAQQNLNAASSFFQWVDTSNISFSIPLSNTQASALPMKIRIVGNFTKSGLNIDYFGINNISLVREITSISVRSTKTPQPPLITHSAGASVTLDTDFGSLLTNEESEAVDKTYRITNTGTRTLNINSIQLSPGNVGFSVVGAVPSSIIAGGSATFTVRFAPVNQGLQTAEVVISGNISPDNPFRFEVKGAGKSCNLTPVPIAQYGFEGAPPSNMDVTQSSGNVKIIGGTTSSPSTSFGRLYYTNGNANTNLYSSSSPTRSWYVRGTDTNQTTIEFGPVDLTNQQEVSINFDLAAFGLTNDNNSGVNNSDYVILSVYNPTTNSWSDEIRLNGSNNTTRRKYAYGASGIAEGTYDGNNTAIQFTNNAINYGSFKLNIPASISQLRYRITAYTSRTWSGGWQNYNLWLIDNVHVDAGNAKFKTWNGTAWVGENANRPGPREKAVFAGDYNFTATDNTMDLSVCECEVNSSAVLTIPSGKALTVSNKIVNHGDGNNFVVASDGNLIQIEDGAVNSRMITVRRKHTYKADNLRKEYNFLSSPVADQNMRTIFGGNPANISNPTVLNESTNYFVNATASDYLIKGKGFSIKEPKHVGFISTNGQPEDIAQYQGVPNNGKIEPVITRSAANRGWNLIGNPYPSNLDLKQVYEDNKDVISSEFRFWDNKVNATYTQYGGNYNGYSYAIYNAKSNLGNPAPGGDAGGNTGTPGTSTGTEGQFRYAKVSQAFLVRNSATSYPASNVVKFVNNQRKKEGTTFFGRGTANDEDNRNIFRLQLVTPGNLLLTQSILYFAEGSDAFGLEDSKYPSSSASDMFYSYAGEEKVLINALSDFEVNNILHVGYRAFTAGTYTIKVADLLGVFGSGQAIYLKDKDLGIITDLTKGDYTFSSNLGEFTNRFEIVYKTESVLATAGTFKSEIEVYRDASDFVVRTSDQHLQMLELYDASGRLVFGMNATGREARFNSDRLTEGMYIIKAIMKDGVIMTKKIRK